MKKINILGTEYTIDIDDEIFEDGFDGLCKPYDKQIYLRSTEKYLEPNDLPETKKIRMEEVARHEIIHAFFHEAGLEEYCDNEMLVSWLALQFPKMLKVFNELECI